MAAPGPARERDRSHRNRRERIAENISSTRWGGWIAVHIANPIDRVLIPLSGNRVSVFRMMAGPRMPLGMLHATGAKSGEPRSTPLLYLPDEDRIVLIASRGGTGRIPAWYFNLRAHPDVTFLCVDRQTRSFRARQAEGPERAELWRKVNELYKGYDDYQDRNPEREIPVMVLDPRPTP